MVETNTSINKNNKKKEKQRKKQKRNVHETVSKIHTIHLRMMSARVACVPDFVLCR
jgi:hypothetical protein